MLDELRYLKITILCYAQWVKVCVKVFKDNLSFIMLNELKYVLRYSVLIYLVLYSKS